MPIVNNSKIRPDVLKFAGEYVQMVSKHTRKVLLKRFYLIPKILALNKKLDKANTALYRDRILDSQILKQMVPQKDLLFLAKISRELNDALVEWFEQAHPYPPDFKLQPTTINQIPVEWQIPANAHPTKMVMYFHGGGFCINSIHAERPVTVQFASQFGQKFLSVEYRRAPERPFPAALDDCYAVYRGCLDQGIKPQDIILMGASAGGALVLSVLTKLKHEKIPMPAAAICLSPLTDLSFNDLHMLQNAETDIVLGDGFAPGFPLTYLGDADPKNPLVSPYWGELAGFPPLFIQASKSEMVYFDNQNFVEKAQKANVKVTFHAWADMPHCFLGYGPFNPGWSEIPEGLLELESFIRTIEQNRTLN